MRILALAFVFGYCLAIVTMSVKSLRDYLRTRGKRR